MFTGEAHGLDDLYGDLLPAGALEPGEGDLTNVDPAGQLGDDSFQDDDEFDAGQVEPTNLIDESFYDFEPGEGDDGDEDDSDGAEGNDDDTDEDTKDVVSALLKTLNIDVNAVQYENEDGEIETHNFHELPLEDQLNILKGTGASDDLNDSEVEAVNFLRENKVTLEETIKYFQRLAVEEHINSQNYSGTNVDQYSDEELFVLDLKTKYEDLTDDELEIELQKQLQHPELFKKKIDKTRQEYLEVEQQQVEQAKNQEAEAEAQRYAELETTLVGVAQDIADIGGLDLEIDDKNQILSYILDKDLNGQTAFVKALQSPKALFNMAWFATKGEEAFDVLHSYYKDQIKEVRETSYKKGLEDSKGKPKAVETANKRAKVIKTSDAQNFKPGLEVRGKISTINDLYKD